MVHFSPGWSRAASSGWPETTLWWWTATSSAPSRKSAWSTRTWRTVQPNFKIWTSTAHLQSAILPGCPGRISVYLAPISLLFVPLALWYATLTANHYGLWQASSSSSFSPHFVLTTLAPVLPQAVANWKYKASVHRLNYIYVYRWFKKLFSNTKE